MTDEKRIDRKTFLKLSITIGASTWVVACTAEDPGTTTPPPGTGGVGGAGGTGGAGTGGTAGATTGGAGTGGAATGGAGTGGAATGGAGTGGAATGGAGAGGATAGMGGSNAGMGGNNAGMGGNNAGAGGAMAGNAGQAAGGMGAGGMSGGMGGKAGASGAAGSGMAGGGGGDMCMQNNLTMVAMPAGTHDHMPGSITMELAMHINGSMATMAFELPNQNNHIHTITLTQNQVDTLRTGGSVTGVVSSNDSNHTHTYNIECMA